MISQNYYNKKQKFPSGGAKTLLYVPVVIHYLLFFPNEINKLLITRSATLFPVSFNLVSNIFYFSVQGAMRLCHQ